MLMPIIRRKDVPAKTGGNYPAPHDDDLGRCEMWPLGDAGGLTQFGALIETLYPGAFSSLRHWHEKEDEFLYLLDGEVVLIDDDGEHAMQPGDAAAFRAGDQNGHRLQNRSGRPATYLMVGTRATEDRCHYADVDMLLTKTKTGKEFTRRDGTALRSTP
jgi:uncharacterized cupin superfamily protein